MTKTVTAERSLLKELDAARQDLPGASLDRRTSIFTRLTILFEESPQEYLQHKEEIDSRLRRIKALKGCSGKIPELKRVIKAAVENYQEKQVRQMLMTATSMNVTQALAGDVPKGLPSVICLSDLTVPVNYEVTLQGVFSREPDAKGTGWTKTRLAQGPILPVAVSQDIHDSQAILTMIWRTPTGRWVIEHVPRDTIYDARKLASLARNGAPVSSNNAKDVMKFIEEFEAENGSAMVDALGCSRLGWIKVNGEWDFLLPEGCVGHSEVLLQPPSGAESIAQAASKRGVYEKWQEAVGLIQDHPVPMLSIYHAVSGLLLERLGAPNFVIDFAGETSRGKTTTLRLEASVWGNGDVTGHTLVNSWEMTQVAIERTAAFLYNLPVILDDTKRAKEPRARTVTNVIYELANGRGRARGKPNGMRVTDTWHCPAASSGESSAVDFANAAGARARTLSVRMLPFGEPSVETGNKIARVNKILARHYGHLGRECAKLLLQNEDMLPYLQDFYDQKRKELVDRADTADGVAQRCLVYVAILATAAELAHAAGLPGSPDKAIEVAYQAALASSEDSDKPLEAMRRFNSWLWGNSEKFYGQARDRGQPMGGWWGVWNTSEEDWQYLYLRPDKFNELMVQWNHEPAEIIDRWRKRGWLKMDSKGEIELQMKHMPGKPRMYWIRREALEG